MASLQQRPVVIHVTAAERASWRRIAAHFGWWVTTGTSMATTPNPDFNAPIRRIAAAWSRHPHATRQLLAPCYAAALPTPIEARRGRPQQWKGSIRLTREEATAWDTLALTFDIVRGRRKNPFLLEAIRRLGQFATTPEGWPVVIEAIAAINDLLPEPFVRVGHTSPRSKDSSIPAAERAAIVDAATRLDSRRAVCLDVYGETGGRAYQKVKAVLDADDAAAQNDTTARAPAPTPKGSR